MISTDLISSFIIISFDHIPLTNKKAKLAHLLVLAHDQVNGLDGFIGQLMAPTTEMNYHNLH